MARCPDRSPQSGPFSAGLLGLDNDGDDLYDEADLIDCPEPGETLMLGVGIGFLLLAGRWRARR